MSGPKTYDYRLTAQQRAILREQARIRRLTEETKRLIENRKRNVSNTIAAVDRLIERIEAIYKETGVVKDISVYKENRRKAMVAVDSTFSLGGKGLNELQSISEALNKAETELRKNRPELEKITDEVEKKFETDVQTAILESFSASYTEPDYENTVENNDTAPKIDFSSKITAMFERLENLHLTDELTSKIDSVKLKSKSINNNTFMKNFYSMTVIPLVKECKKCDEVYSKKYSEFSELTAKYEALALEAGIKVKEFVLSEQAIVEIKAEITALETQLNRGIEQEYISKCVDEAMQKMGYKLIGEREKTRKSGKKFKNELYLFDEGTAVNVTFADNGQITMELGGIDHADRVPTDAESRQLSENMQSFCDDYKEISAYLKKKGIEMTKISHLPPDSQYAQIINVSDYSLTETVADYSTRQTKSGTASQKAMHKNF